MTKIAIFGLIVIVAMLVGASVVLAQDATTTTPGAAVNTPVCPVGLGGPDSEQKQQMRDAMGEAMQSGNMQEMHDSMGQYVPEEMRERHDSMGQAMQNGDIENMRGTCQNYMNGQNNADGEPAPETPPASANTNARGGMMSNI